MDGAEAGGIIALLGWMIAILILPIIVMIAAMWKIFTKAGKPGWAAIVPIYNYIIMLEIVGKPIWWIVLMFIPLVNVVVGILILVELCKSFGKGTGFVVGMIFLGPIFLCILGFGSAQYLGPGGMGVQQGGYPQQPQPGYPPQPGPPMA